MKKLIFTGFMAFFSLTANAATLPHNVLAERTTFVMFAPEEYLGFYKFQLLVNGTVQRVDNKNKVTQLSTLSPNVMSKLKASVDNIKTDALSEPEGPHCMDAPLQTINIRQSDGHNMSIWKNEDCRVFAPLDNSAADFVKVLDNLDNVFEAIDRLYTLKN